MSDRKFTEDEVQDLTDRVFLLRQHLEEGRIHFAAHLIDDFRKSFEAIRLRPDGRVDPATVDGRIRSATLMLRHFKYRQEAKDAISLGDIQGAYFDQLFRQLGWLYDQAKQAGASPSQVAHAMHRDAKFVKGVCAGLPEFAAELKHFWEVVGDAGAYHLQDGEQFKATFSGDIFPLDTENPISTAGLYIDTIVLPCPVMRIAPLLGVYPDEEVVRLLIKHSLTAMSYREAATADVAPPIALIIPNPDDLRRGSDNTILSRAEPAILKHGSYLFGRRFTEVDELQEFCSHLATIDQVMVELKGGDRLLFDTQWEEIGAELQLQRAMREKQPVIPGFDSTIAGHHVFSACLGRMPQALGSKENGAHFGGTPFIGAETSWRYYTWFLEYESIDYDDGTQSHVGTHITRALASEAQQNLSWLGRVPVETVIEIRRNGGAEELRQILSAGVEELVELRPDNYFRTADQVVDNLSRAFERHQQQVREARDKKLKLYGLDVGSLITTGAIAVTAALTGNGALGAASGLLGLAGLPNLKDVHTKFKALAEEERARKSSPTGLLFKHVRRT